ncbi:UDP-N-acetylglucosamine 1-carboxyvinyltransferase [Orientia chuto str. Dubai]|uniref:UDP-N-acetylglucosamine 1-carboxyvinyltransferase n=1 Tax=Orientia chuto str. Dubai TaxID=1359168 RepID=A0A0F3MLE0_9RICK|nr:UDP-N-acetylglucosamine 1-carboxyvinyltransferase [Candidatus Orientia mediorientalis]KJV56282.1 UDP-N-acetylglucosamine 1-carboxyvinyltransferase [Orientia chuto str. Dubai]
MGNILVEGGCSLRGEVNISGAKNAALPIIIACLLSSKTLVVSNIPQLSDVSDILSLLKNCGVLVEVIGDGTIALTADKITNDFVFPCDLVKKTRASIWILVPLLLRLGRAKIALPGGCAIGRRRIDLHVAVLEAFGANIQVDDVYISANCSSKLYGINFTFNKISVGATITAIMIAVLAKGSTKLTNCAQEPEIVDLCYCLRKMGADINGIGTANISIVGVKELNGTNYSIIPDRIEAGTYMIAAAITKGKIQLNNVIFDHLKSVIVKLQLSGAIIQYQSKNSLIIEGASIIKQVNVQTNPYPNFPTDLQAQFMSLMSIAQGVSVITENIYENRYKHAFELIKMGANIVIQDRKAIVTGVKKLHGTEVVATDLRASVSLILAGLSADGLTRVTHVHHLDRGYEFLVKKLQNCNARIQRISA